MADYSKMFHNYDDMFDGTPRQLNPNTPKENNSPTLGSDLAYQATAAANSGFAGLARTANTLFSDGVDGELTKRLDANAQYANEQLSPEQKAANQKQFISDKEGETFGSAVSDPRAYSGVVASALGSFVPSIATGGVLSSGLKSAAGLASKGLGLGAKASGIATGVAGATGYGLSEAGMVAGGVSGDIQTTINTMPQAVIDQSPRYQDLIKTMSDTDARGVLGREVGVQGMKDVALPTALLGTVAGRFIDKALAGKLTGASRLKNAGIGALTEAPTEAAQGGYEQCVKNTNLGEIDPSIAPLQGVADASFKEGFGGAAMGSGVGALSRRPSVATPEDAINQNANNQPTSGVERLSQLVSDFNHNQPQTGQQPYNDLLNQFGLPRTGDSKPTHALDLTPIGSQQVTPVNNQPNDLSTQRVKPNTVLEGELLDKQTTLNSPRKVGLPLAPINGELVTGKLQSIKALPAPEKAHTAKARKAELTALLPYLKGFKDIKKAINKDITVLSLIEKGKEKNNQQAAIALLPLEDKLTSATQTAKAFKAQPDIYQKLLTIYQQQRDFNATADRRANPSEQNVIGSPRDAATSTGSDTNGTERNNPVRASVTNSSASDLIYEDKTTGEQYTHLGEDRYQDANGEIWNFDKGELQAVQPTTQQQRRDDRVKPDGQNGSVNRNADSLSKQQQGEVLPQNGGDYSLRGETELKQPPPINTQETLINEQKNTQSKETPITAQPAEEINPILVKSKKSYLNNQLKEQQIKPNSPGYAQAKARIEQQYEQDLEHAQFSLPFDQFKQLKENAGQPEGLLKQSYEVVRGDLGIKTSNPLNEVGNKKALNEQSFNDDIKHDKQAQIKNSRKTIENDISDVVSNFYGEAAFMGNDELDNKWIDKFVETFSKYDDKPRTKQKLKSLGKKLVKDVDDRAKNPYLTLNEKFIMDSDVIQSLINEQDTVKHNENEQSLNNSAEEPNAESKAIPVSPNSTTNTATYGEIVSGKKEEVSSAISRIQAVIDNPSSGYSARLKLQKDINFIAKELDKGTGTSNNSYYFYKKLDSQYRDERHEGLQRAIDNLLDGKLPAAGEATHIEDDKIERVTANVVSKSLTESASNQPIKSKTEMRKWLVRLIRLF